MRLPAPELSRVRLLVYYLLRVALHNLFSYIQQGLGLAIVDVVTDRTGNLHDQLLARLGPAGTAPMGTDLYSVASRPFEHSKQPSLDIWQQALAVGHLLVTLPLWLRGNLCLLVDLEATYNRTCQEQRIMTDAS